MKNNIQIGQKFPVVEIISDGLYGDEVFPKGAWCASYKVPEEKLSGLQVLERDGKNWLYLSGNEIKVVGCLTIRKIK